MDCEKVTFINIGGKNSKTRKITRALTAALFGMLIFTVSGCGDGDNGNSNSSTEETVPAAPTGVTATATSSSSITVSWNAVSGAIGYYVYRSATSSGTFSQVGATTTATTYTNTGLTDGTTYYYRVAAYNGEGTGEQSSVVSAMTEIVIPEPTDELTDSRDNKKYRTVDMPDGKTWMAENLNYATSSGSWCYNNQTSNCNTYGRLYDWNTAMTACPVGWHLSTAEEWTALGTAVSSLAFLGGSFIWYDVGKKLKAVIGWSTTASVGGQTVQYSPGTDDYGFSALPGGSRSSANNYFLSIGEIGYWWTATDADDDDTRAIYINMSNSAESAGFYPNGSDKANAGFSVRCVKND